MDEDRLVVRELARRFVELLGKFSEGGHHVELVDVVAVARVIALVAPGRAPAMRPFIEAGEAVLRVEYARDYCPPPASGAAFDRLEAAVLERGCLAAGALAEEVT